MLVPASALPKLFRLDRETGKLFWLPRAEDLGKKIGRPVSIRSIKIFNTLFAGAEAMTATTEAGYKIGSIFCQSHYAHRVIWAIEHGEWPSLQIDHINGDRVDNRPDNLRLANQSQNNANARKRFSCTSRFKGVSWSPNSSKWCVQATRQGEKRPNLYFENEVDAAKAYDRIAKEIHGEYAKTNEALGLLE